LVGKGVKMIDLEKMRKDLEDSKKELSALHQVINVH